MFVETKRDGEARIVNEWQQILLDAANLLEAEGWCQHTLMDKENRRCILGAIYYQSCSQSLQIEAHSRMVKYLGCDVDIWNDAPGRTKEEAVAALRSAAMQGLNHDA